MEFGYPQGEEIAMSPTNDGPFSRAMSIIQDESVVQRLVDAGLLTVEGEDEAADDLLEQVMRLQSEREQLLTMVTKAFEELTLVVRERDLAEGDADALAETAPLSPALFRHHKLVAERRPVRAIDWGAFQ